MRVPARVASLSLKGFDEHYRGAMELLDQRFLGARELPYAQYYLSCRDGASLRV